MDDGLVLVSVKGGILVMKIILRGWNVKRFIYWWWIGEIYKMWCKI